MKVMAKSFRREGNLITIEGSSLYSMRNYDHENEDFVYYGPTTNINQLIENNKRISETHRRNTISMRHSDNQ